MFLRGRLNAQCTMHNTHTHTHSTGTDLLKCRFQSEAAELFCTCIRLTLAAVSFFTLHHVHTHIHTHTYTHTAYDREHKRMVSLGLMYPLIHARFSNEWRKAVTLLQDLRERD